MASIARQALLERLDAYRRAIALPAIVDRAPSQRTHNAQARLLRNGLMVVGFALLEDFLRSRAAEVLEWLTVRRLDYVGLPGKLQDAMTGGAVRALGAQFDIRRRGGADPSLVLEEVGRSFVSLTSREVVFWPLTLGWRGSNLGVEEISDMLGALSVQDPWRNIENIARRAGLGFLVARDAFVNASVLRNVAAHQATANVQPTDLEFFARNAFGFALGFDAMISRGARLVAEGATGGASGALLAMNVALRFLERDRGSWRERAEGRPRTVRRETNYRRLESSTRRRARARHDLIVVLNDYGQPYRWITTDVP